MTTATTSLSYQVRSAFPFSVDKFPLRGPDGMRTPHYGLFRSDTGECVGNAVRQGYQPHTVDDICALVDAAASAFDGDAAVRCTWHDGHVVTVAPSDEYRQSVYGTRDNIWPRLIVRASYDGKAFRSSLGFFRDACRNLAMIRSEGRTVAASIKHTYGLPGKLTELRQHFAALAASWNDVVETAQAMEANQVNLAEFLRSVYPLREDASDRTRRSHERRVEAIVRRVVRERQHTGRPDLDFRMPLVSGWEAFNGVQGYVQHDQTRRGQLDEFGRAVRALDDAAVGRAHNLALAV